ncbi:MAG: sel1 repeat family protein [Muribaculaceae bacterium]|nr:sel1 repeat family protein [Muribaculaceae bacterium]
MRRIFITILSFVSFFPFISQGQEFKVASFDYNPSDLTARVGEYSRVDLDGRKCAILKISVADDIVEAQGNVVGDIIKKGMEKWIYIAHDSKHVKLLFDKHHSLMLNFIDYNYPVVSEQMVYDVKLEEKVSNDSGATNKLSVDRPQETELLKDAKKAYEERDFAKALRLFSKIDNDKEAQYYLGEMYYEGEGVSKNDKEAAIWFRKSADQGYALSQANLGLLYLCGYGVEEDCQEAIKWFTKAAEQGDILALRNLGNIYYFGEDIPKDYQEAVKWWRLGAEKGDPDLPYLLGIMYYEGNKINKDYTEAYKWFLKGAEQNNELCQLRIGVMYYNGFGVPVDYKQAAHWWKLSADNGNSRAMFNLGSLYLDGLGVKKNEAEAVKWFKLSADHGNEDAKRKIREMGY